MIARPLALALLLSGAASAQSGIRPPFEAKAMPDAARKLNHDEGEVVFSLRFTAH